MCDSITHRTQSHKEVYPWFTSGINYSFQDHNKYSVHFSETISQANDYSDEFNKLFAAISLLNTRQYRI